MSGKYCKVYVHTVTVFNNYGCVSDYISVVWPHVAAVLCGVMEYYFVVFTSHSHAVTVFMLHVICMLHN